MSSPTASGSSEDARGADPAGAIRVLAASEKRDAVWLLARAFRDNPLNAAVISGGPKRRLRANVHGMRALMASPDPRPIMLAAHTPAPQSAPQGGDLGARDPNAHPGGRLGGGDLGARDPNTRDPNTRNPDTDPGGGGSASLSGILFGVPPYCWPVQGAPLGVQVLSWVGQGPATVRRWSQVYELLERIHPLEPHWYLGILGVEPDRQNAGLGTALLRSWLARVDEEDAASYLETDRAENVGFYRRVGFEVVNEQRVLGVGVWCMWRTPGGKPFDPQGPQAPRLRSPSAT